MKTRLDIRGSVLLLVVVLLAVISLLAAAALSFSYGELGAAKNERSGDELLACADAGRQFMLSRFSMSSGGPVELTPLNVDITGGGLQNCPPPSEGVPEDARCVRSGHITQVSATGIIQVEPQAGGNRRALRDLSNVVGDSGLDGKPFKIIVHCLDENGRGTEVEFLVRFGL